MIGQGRLSKYRERLRRAPLLPAGNSRPIVNCREREKVAAQRPDEGNASVRLMEASPHPALLPAQGRDRATLSRKGRGEIAASRRIALEARP
jgi:hypothetical protein